MKLENTSGSVEVHGASSGKKKKKFAVAFGKAILEAATKETQTEGKQ